MTEMDADATAMTDTDQAETGDEHEVTDDRSSRQGRGRRRKADPELLEEEGEVGADYLEELLDIADLDGDIDIDVENDRASISIVGDQLSTRQLKRLVGKDGEVLEALQELTRLAIHTKTGEHSRAMLDVAEFRADRKRELVTAAQAAIEQVRERQERVRMDPMNAFERKIVHDEVAASGLESESTGEDPNRRVVILPAS